MQKHSWLICTVLILFWSRNVSSGDPAAVPTCEAVQGNLIIANDKSGVKWEGWGTALAWWANWAGGLKNETELKFLLDMLFRADTGLGLNVVRYNIGGGGYSPFPHTQFQGFLKYRAMPGFKWTAKAPFNPDADKNQRKVLLASRSRGANIIEAFSNSPPAYMTVSKSFTGSFQAYEDNLDPGMYRSFANYLVQVTQYYKDNWNVEFRTLEPTNEPEGRWLFGGVQEGCNFKLNSIMKIIQIANHVLSQKTLKTVLAATDSSGYNSVEILKTVSKGTLKRISQVNVHSYETSKIRNSPARQLAWRTNIANNAATLKKKVVVSEWGPYGMKGTAFEYGLTLARQVMLDINVLKAFSWSYWQAIEHFDKAKRWGLIFADMNTQEKFSYQIGFQYYALMHFSKWIRPGAFILKVDSSCVRGLVAAYDYKRNRLTIVLANYLYTNNVTNFNIQFKTVKGLASSMSVYRTSATQTHELIGAWGATFPSMVKTTVTPRSITTYVAMNVFPP